MIDIFLHSLLILLSFQFTTSQLMEQIIEPENSQPILYVSPSQPKGMIVLVSPSILILIINSYYSSMDVIIVEVIGMFFLLKKRLLKKLYKDNMQPLHYHQETMYIIVGWEMMLLLLRNL